MSEKKEKKEKKEKEEFERKMAARLAASSKPPYVTLVEGKGRFVLTVFWWNDQEGGFWEPWEVYHTSFGDESTARMIAKAWAIDLGMEYLEEGDTI